LKANPLTINAIKRRFFICFLLPGCCFARADQISNLRISSTLSEFIPSSDKTDADGLAVAVVRTSGLAEISARVLVRFDHVARSIVNANHSIM
jgi:hypothetical protein